MGQWKLLHNRLEEQKPQLFDLAADIGETTDLSAEHPDRVKDFLVHLDEWETGLVEPLWGSNLSRKEQQKRKAARKAKKKKKKKKKNN